jgi:phage shock protein A
MPKRELLRQLTALQQQLAEIDDAQPEVRSRLASLQTEIQRLERRHAAPVEAAAPPAAEEEDDDDDGFLDRLEEYAADFEAEHPRIAETARDLIRRLASIGI